MKRRWNQFSLRSLLAAVSLLALSVFLVQTVLPYHRQNRVIADLTSRGGKNYQYAQQPVGPEWLRLIFGPRYFREIREIHLGDIPFSDADLPLLDDLPYLKKLVLNKTRLSEKSLAELKRRRPDLQVSQQVISHHPRTSMTSSRYFSWLGLLLYRVLPLLASAILLVIVSLQLKTMLVAAVTRLKQSPGNKLKLRS